MDYEEATWRGTKFSSGFDLKADLSDFKAFLDLNEKLNTRRFFTTEFGSVLLKPSGRMIVPTGIKVSFPHGYDLQVRPRSGLAIKNGIACTLGTIDSDYRGDISIILMNHGDEVFRFVHGSRLAQAVFCKLVMPNFINGDLDSTVRNDGGFGHTGV